MKPFPRILVARVLHQLRSDQMRRMEKHLPIVQRIRSLWAEVNVVRRVRRRDTGRRIEGVVEVCSDLALIVARRVLGSIGQQSIYTVTLEPLNE